MVKVKNLILTLPASNHQLPACAGLITEGKGAERDVGAQSQQNLLARCLVLGTFETDHIVCMLPFPQCTNNIKGRFYSVNSVCIFCRLENTKKCKHRHFMMITGKDLEKRARIRIKGLLTEVYKINQSINLI